MGHQESRQSYKLIQLSFSNSFLISWKNVCSTETNSYMLLSIFNETVWHSVVKGIQTCLFCLISINYCVCIWKHLTPLLSEAAQFSRHLIFHSSSVMSFFPIFSHFISSWREEFPLDHLRKNIAVQRESRVDVSMGLLLMKTTNILSINISHCRI